MGSLDADLETLLRKAMAERENILISGGTGTGKTTLLSALANLIPDEERIFVIEDTSEIQISKPDLVQLEARGPRPDLEPVTVRELVKAALRHRPDRIIVGEVRGAVAFDLLQALNTGHSGSLSTIHANSARHALRRFANCVLESDVDLPYAAIRGSIAESINLIVQIERREGKRLVTEAIAVEGFDFEKDDYDLRRVFPLSADSGGYRTSRPGSLPPRSRQDTSRKPVQRSGLENSA